MKFEIGKYYRHCNGDLAYQIRQRDTAFLIVERSRGEAKDLDEGGQPLCNWSEITKEEYDDIWRREMLR